MSKRKNKTVKLSTERPIPEKIVKKTSNPNSYLDRNVAWSFKHLDHEKWCIKKHFFSTSVYEKILEFETMTWNDVQMAKSKNHTISVEDIIPSARKRLEELNLYYDELFSLRLNGRERIFGILEYGVLRILWYDPNHEICPSTKSHT